MHENWTSVDPVSVLIDGVYPMVCVPKVFKTGSRGWHASGKVELGDERVQVSICLTVVGSKAKPASKMEVASEPEWVQKAPGSLQKARKGKKRPDTLADGSEALEVKGELPDVS